MSTRVSRDILASIYVIVNRRTHVVRYVGCSMNPNKRFYQHTHTRGVANLVGRTCRLVILRRVRSSRALFTEHAMIKLFKACGQADLNKSPGFRKTRAEIAEGVPVVHVESGRIFESYLHASRVMGIASSSITKALKRWNGRLRVGVTFGRRIPKGAS